MKYTRALGTSAVAGGIALAGLLFPGVGTANAAPGHACGQLGSPTCQATPSPQNTDWQHRDVAAARQDHQPFMHEGQRVQPLPAGNGDGWGFWFLGRWIRL